MKDATCLSGEASSLLTLIHPPAEARPGPLNQGASYFLWNLAAQKTVLLQ